MENSDYYGPKWYLNYVMYVFGDKTPVKQIEN